MTPLIALLLLAVGSETKASPHYPGALAVYDCKFESSYEEGIYGWPPGWTRRHGPGFPKYVRIRVEENHPPCGGNSLRVDLDGGAATAYSPVVPVAPSVQYVLEGHVETSGLQNDGAYLSLVFLDSSRNKLSSVSSEKVSGTTAWQKIRLGPVSPPAGASLMLIGLNVEPQGETQDLRGTASFGSLWLGQLPNVVLTARTTKAIPRDRDKPSRSWADDKLALKRSANDVTFSLFPRGQPIDIACLVSGVATPEYEIRLELFDSDGRKLAEHRQKSDVSQPVHKASFDVPRTEPERMQDIPVVAMDSRPEKPPSTPSFTRATWRLPGDTVGFCRVRATVVPVATLHPSASRAASPILETTPQTELSLAIIEPQMLPAGSEFGWSLGPNDADLGLGPLADLLCQCGIRWVKFPVAVKETVTPPAENGANNQGNNAAKNAGNAPQGADSTTKKASTEPAVKAGPKSQESAVSSLEPLINFSDRLSAAGVRLACVLQPPRAASDAGRSSIDLLAAETFAQDPKTWYPSIEPLLARLAVEIRFWQIGSDRDPGWVGCRDLAGIVSRTKAELDRIGQDLDVGITWNLAAPLPIVTPSPKADRPRLGKAESLPVADSNRQKTPWRFLSLPCDLTIGNDTIAKRLDSTKSAGTARWIVFDTLPREGHAARDRIVHLVNRMLTAKMHGAEAIFVANPFDPDRGLVDRNGSPSELFLPWRTTALTLGGAPYLGDIDLPHGNRIHCFGGSEQYIGVLAGSTSGQETVFLGTELQTRDLWGDSRACPPTVSENESPIGLAPAPRSTITLEQLPSFLVGLNGPITRWQLAAAFSPNRLPSIPSSLVPVSLELKNTFSRPVSGRISICGPQNWQIEPRTAEFRLDPGAAWKQHLEVALPNDVVGGRQMVRLDLEIQADHLYRFAMYRPLEVTLGDVVFDGQTVLNSHGDMEVRQTLANQGKKAARFRCDLLAPDRRRQSTEVLLQPAGTSEVTYRLPDGEQLRGKAIWLRAEEIDGPRILNYRIEAPAAATPATVPEEVPKRGQLAPPRLNPAL